MSAERAAGLGRHEEGNPLHLTPFPLVSQPRLAMPCWVQPAAVCQGLTGAVLAGNRGGGGGW